MVLTQLYSRVPSLTGSMGLCMGRQGRSWRDVYGQVHTEGLLRDAGAAEAAILALPEEHHHTWTPLRMCRYVHIPHAILIAA